MALNLHFSQFVLPFERKVKQKCDICNSGYRLGKSQHICKRCCRSVCQDCAPFKTKCYMPDYKNSPHRLCRKCNSQSEVIKKYIKQNKLRWGEDSQLVKVWLKQLGLTSVPRKRNNQKKIINEYVAFQDIWKSFNFSFRQFIGIIIDEAKINQKQFVELINLALSELAGNKLADLQHLVYVVIFFLAHCNINSAIYFSTLIMQMTYGQELSMQNMHYLLQQMHCSQIQTYKMESIIDEIFQKTVKRCTLNVFTIQISIEIISHVIAKRQFQQLEKGIAFVFSQRKQFICQNSNKPDDVILDILRNLTSIDYRGVIKSINGSNSSPQKSERNSENRSSNSETNSIKSPGKSRHQQIQSLKRENLSLKQRLRQQEKEIQQLRQGKSSPRKPEGGIKSKQKFKNDAYSTSEQFNDESNFSQIINKKNLQIIQLKKQLDNLNEQLNGTTNKGNGSKKTFSDREQEYKKQIKNKQDTIQKLKLQIQSLKNTNKKLFMKLNQLSVLLMDKQEKTLEQANKKFDEINQEIEKSKLSKQQLEKQCRIF